MLHRCYQFKTTGATKPIERGCYEVYGNGGDLININCEWGFVFHPEKELFKFPNYAIFQVNLRQLKLENLQYGTIEQVRRTKEDFPVKESI